MTLVHRLLLALGCSTALAAAPKTENVILVTMDGLRWQEVFRGAEETFLTKEHGGMNDKTIQAARETLLAPTPEERRRKLMPFFWGEIAARGQIFGNRDRGSEMRVTNAEWISYPGYSELLCGYADPLVTSNVPLPNRNTTVLEWLHGREGFAGRVVACTTWQVFPAILNVGRSRLPLWVSGQRNALAARSPRLADLDVLMQDIPLKARDEHYDGFAYHAAVEMLDMFQPRVFFIAFGEPDTNAHSRRYDAYLESITRCDRFVRQLWEKLQALPQYRDRTTLIVTVDHGRGETPQNWTTHNKQTPHANETWLAIMGPDTPARGERTGHAPIASAQVAATVAAALGQDLPAAEPRAAAPLPDVLTR